MLESWSLVPLLFLNLVWTSGVSQFTYCWSLAWRILRITLLVCEMSVIMWKSEHSLALPFFGIGMTTDLFQPVTTAEFSKFAGILSAALSQHHFFFGIWNSSTGIPSPPLVLFIVILPKAHLTSYSRMSDSRWVIIPSWLSGSWISFRYSSSVYSCHLFLITSASVKSILFLSFIEPIFAWNVPLVSIIFLKRALVFPSLMFSSISLHWSLRKAFLCLLAILWNSAFKRVYLSFSPLLLASLFSQLFVRPPQIAMRMWSYLFLS